MRITGSVSDPMQRISEQCVPNQSHHAVQLRARMSQTFPSACLLHSHCNVGFTFESIRPAALFLSNGLDNGRSKRLSCRLAAGCEHAGKAWQNPYQ